jgi:hypothetical protein
VGQLVRGDDEKLPQLTADKYEFSTLTEFIGSICENPAREPPLFSLSFFPSRTPSLVHDDRSGYQQSNCGN